MFNLNLRYYQVRSVALGIVSRRINWQLLTTMETIDGNILESSIRTFLICCPNFILSAMCKISVVVHSNICFWLACLFFLINSLRLCMSGHILIQVMLLIQKHIMLTEILESLLKGWTSDSTVKHLTWFMLMYQFFKMYFLEHLTWIKMLCCCTDLVDAFLFYFKQEISWKVLF